MSDKLRESSVGGPYPDVETAKEEFGTAYGWEVAYLTAEQVAALLAGKVIAVAVHDEYVTFVSLTPLPPSSR